MGRNRWDKQKGWSDSKPLGAPKGKGRKTSGTTFRKDGDYQKSRQAYVEQKKQDALKQDDDFGYARYKQGDPRLGWLFNLQATTIVDEDGVTRAAMDYYFVEQDGSTFKATLLYDPYFFVAVKEGTNQDMESFLRKRFADAISNISFVEKEDLDLSNHISGLKATYIKIECKNVNDLMEVRSVLLPAVKKNKRRKVVADVYDDPNIIGEFASKSATDSLGNLLDIREYDVPYHIRVSIDLEIRVGHWYVVTPKGNSCLLDHRADLVERPALKVVAFDIETTKLPLKFPDPKIDQVMMISYMIDGEGYLIVNREIVSEDIETFNYTPNPEYEGEFTVFNEANETELLNRWFSHMREVKPHVYTTYNGDFFDWPFLEARAKTNGLNMENQIGVSEKQSEYRARFACHLDCFYWVKRDSYLPAGSHGLKAVAKAKLGYNPVELDPEDMLPFASSRPQELATYSVSDAVATYYLYMKYVNPFIFSLCTIIPMNPDDVLRKGSGTLCEQLLMVQSYRKNIICPNKQQGEGEKFHKGHLLESETYIGGHVEALESGVFRADFDYKYKLDASAFQELLDNLDEYLEFAIVKEGGLKMEEVTNYDEVKSQIAQKLEDLRDNPVRQEKPLIYHLDVSAMYPNIILTNRLQPSSIVNETVCAACDFNRPESRCQRKMQWTWRGEVFPASRAEYERMKLQIESELVTVAGEDEPVPFVNLPIEDQRALLKKRFKTYNQTAYKKVHDTIVEDQEATVCQRENPFYVDTVRAFRDRRYEYKKLCKVWGGKLKDSEKEKDVLGIEKAKNLLVVYDSLQLAHKCILNSFYGYVMRRGARWYSMEMAGVVTLTGARIIKQARELVERIGRPLELDTDGIWAILPKSFPEDFTFTTNNEKKPKLPISYPCVMLNARVYGFFTNDQYQDLVDEKTKEYSIKSENSIEFEVDGPYLAMVLPASKEEDKKLKKRYAVFNFDKSLAELKGFEIKRRGELKLIKIFQSSVFKTFLHGSDLSECYQAVGGVANHWLGILLSKGAEIEDHEVMELLSESSSMSRTLEDYGNQKSCAITTAKRLAEFLGDQMVKDKGLACQYVISQQPHGSPVTERAVPTAIFSASPVVRRHYLKRWTKDNNLTDFSLRSLLDWEYYIERLGSAIQKIITIPAALQRIDNPVPRVPHPDWLLRRLQERNDPLRQTKMSDMFNRMPKTAPMTPQALGTPHRKQLENGAPNTPTLVDIENIGDMGVGGSVDRPPMPISRKFSSGKNKRKEAEREAARQADLEILQFEENPELEGDPADLDVDGMHDWIEYHKKKWRAQRKRRKLREEERENEDSQVGLMPRKGIGNFFNQQVRPLSSRLWQVLKISETPVPGQFKMWVLSEGENINCVNLDIPRIFYVNYRKESNSHNGGKKVSRQLPRQRPLHHLYQVALPEVDFQENKKELNAFLTHPDVEGVYETQVPLSFRAIESLGCIAGVRLDARKKTARDTFLLDDFEFKTVADQQYLGEEVTLRKAFFYHIQSGRRSVYALMCGEVDEPFRRLSVVVVSPNGNAENVNVPKLLREHPDVSALNANVSAVFVNNQKEADKELQRIFTDARENIPVPQLLCMQTARSMKSLQYGIPALSTYPDIVIPNHDRDNEMPAFGWVKAALPVMMERFKEMPAWYEEQLHFARYAHAPVGNLEKDSAVFASDLFYARSLHANNHLLWMSPSSKPDLGGMEEDENYFVDEHENPSISKTGYYRNACLQVDVSGLAVTTILQSGTIHELEGADPDLMEMGNMQQTLESTLADRNTSTMVDETLSCSTSFKILKAMLNSWVQDVVGNSNEHADTLIVHFYRWLCSPTSLMYDPALHRLVHRFMKKMFMQLLGEFKKYNSLVIFANFDRLIISTTKTTHESALAYVQYVINAIRKKELFMWLGLDPSEVYESFLFMDPSNYGGMRFPALEDQHMEDGDSDGISQGEEEPLSRQQIVCNWNIALYLPRKIQQLFNVIVSEFVYLPSKFKSQLKHMSSQPSDRKDSADEAFLKYVRDLVNGHFCPKLLHYVREIQQRRIVGIGDDDYDEADDGYEFPELAGSHLHMANPALEFVKFVCHVFALDNDIEAEVLSLRRVLLRLVGVREFASEAVFQDPCLSFTLPDVICTYCTLHRDIDLCRDPSLMQEEWACPQCSQLYDKEHLESVVVNIVQRRVIAYQLQDLKCSKCGQVKTDNMNSYCSCSGAYKLTIERQSFLDGMLTFHQIAKFHNLTWLRDVVEDVLQLENLSA